MNKAAIAETEQLMQKAQAEGRALEPVELVAAAQSGSYPALKAYFQWDDAAAADAYRLDQARRLIRSIQIKTDDRPPIRKMVHVRGKDKSGYRQTEQVMKTEDLKSVFIRNLLDEARRWAQRARAYQEFAGVVSAIDELDKLSDDKSGDAAGKAA